MKTQELEKVEKRVPAAPAQEPTVTVLPDVDVCESDTAFTIIADMPGVSENTVEVDLDRNVLTLRGRPALETPKECAIAYREYRSSSYERVFTLGDGVDRTGVKATVKDGVLRLHLPKAKEAQPQRVPVQVG